MAIQRGNIDRFKAKVKKDFARPNLFEVELNFPGAIAKGVGASRLGAFTVRAANLPSSQIGVVEVPFRGRVLKIAGDRTFEPWTITIMNDSNFRLRKIFEKWAKKIQAYNENFTAAGTLGNADDSAGYFADMYVHQLSRDLRDGRKPQPLRTYKFIDVFPSNISAIDLDFGSNDAIEEFTVELQVQYWKPVAKGSSTRDSSDDDDD